MNPNGTPGDSGGSEQPGVGVSTRVIGMRLGVLDAAARQQFSVPATVHNGAVVVSVSSGSDAGHIGVKPGFVIQRAGDHVVNAPSDVVAAVAEARRAGRPSILLLIEADGHNSFVPVKLDSGDAQK